MPHPHPPTPTRVPQAFPGLVAALGPGLHRTAPGITEQLVDCSGGGEVSEESGFKRKAAALLAVLQEQRAPRTIVFCNKIETCACGGCRQRGGGPLCRACAAGCQRRLLCLAQQPTPTPPHHCPHPTTPPAGRKVENFLNRTWVGEPGGAASAASMQVLPHHAAIAEDRRDANLRRFLAAPGGADAGGKGGRQQRRGGRDSRDEVSADDQLTLVCTDRASRGLDSAWVEHVVLFDLPRDPSEYLRRVGRTTRGAAGSGVVTVLALGRQVRWAGLGRRGVGRECADRKPTRRQVALQPVPLASLPHPPTHPPSPTPPPQVKLAKEIIDRNQGGLALHRIPAALPVAMAAPSDDADRLAADLAAVAAAAAGGSSDAEEQEQQEAEAAAE